MNRYFTIGLFKETAIHDKQYVLFTLEEAKSLYMACRDITGYQFAIQHLGGWQHFKALYKSPALSPILDEWEEELEVALRSEALKKIETLSTGDKGYQAAKFLVDKGWKEKTKGRTTKEAIQKEARINEKVYDEFNNVVDFKK